MSLLSEGQALDLDHDMEYDSAFSIDLWAISHLANFHTLATSGTDVRDEEWKSISVQPKNTKRWCIHVSNIGNGGFPLSSEIRKIIFFNVF